MQKIERPGPPFASVPRDYVRGSRWTEPRLVAEIAYSNWTPDGVMRHPKFLALREDKPAQAVMLEWPPSAPGRRRTDQR
jgi:bifunctional non-homologous end joining protein LigD